jgi:hypothetical protein
MHFDYKFSGNSEVKSNSSSVAMEFAPDVLRDPTYFIGELNQKIPFREAISALHDIVVSDFRFKPKDKSDYKAWAEQQEAIWVADFLKGHKEVKEKIEPLKAELERVRKEKDTIMAPFNSAKRKYFDHIYLSNRDAWVVLDPVITVHPDELFFECFSKDESSYGKLGCNYNVFQQISDFKCGTTNIDYSSSLYDEFQKIRQYKKTDFRIDPSGFEVQTEKEELYKEVKIDLPDSWVRGFLQVSSAMQLSTVQIELQAMDLHNICFVLKRNKEKEGPRSLRYVLEPGKPVKLVFDPWNLVVECPRSIYQGKEKIEIRTWGRRRILLLERLIPVAKKFTVVLLGNGLPSFYVADLGDMNFTLGLSGWTANDWSALGNFDLLAPRGQADSLTMQKVYVGLKEKWVEDAESLSKRLGLDNATVKGALSAFTQAGRVVYDLDKKMYRIRELSREALPVDSLRFANEREESATRFVDMRKVNLQIEESPDKIVALSGTVQDSHQVYRPTLMLDQDQKIRKASCSCNFYQQNKLMKGPCEHILALRIMWREKQNFNSN